MGTATDITIPSTLGVEKVDNFTDFFNRNTTIERVTIENGVNPFSGYAFANCTNLKSVTLPSDMTMIEHAMFNGCTSLATVVWPSNLTSIKAETFAGCTSLTEITLPDGVTEIGANAFKDCTGLTKVVIPYGTSTIDDTAFSGYGSNFKLFVVPDSYALQYAVKNNIPYQEYGAPPALKPGDSKDIDYKNTTVLIKPDVDGVFTLKVGIPIVTLKYPTVKVLNGAEIKMVGSNALGNDSYLYYSLEKDKLYSVSLYNTNGSGTYKLTFLKSSCTADGFVYEVFNQDTAHIGGYVGNKTDVTIPNTVDNIEVEGFTDFFNGNQTIKKITISENVNALVGYTFTNCTNLESVTLPSSIGHIDWAMFMGCTSLTTVNIPDGVTEIYESAFKGCTSLETLTFSKNITSIEANAFNGCTKLKLRVPYNCYAERYAIANGIRYENYGTAPTALTLDAQPITAKCVTATYSVTPTADGIYAIKNEGADDCPNPRALSSKTGSKAKNIRTIGFADVNYYYYELEANTMYYVTFTFDQATAGTFELSWITPTVYDDKFIYVTVDGGVCLAYYVGTSPDVTVPATINGMGVDLFTAFGDNETIENVIIENGVIMYINSFSNCTNLESVTLPNTLKRLRDETFLNCSSLKEIVLPDGVTEICDGAFKGCTSLEQMTIPHGVTKIGYEAFLGSGLQRVIIPDSVVEIDETAFDPTPSTVVIHCYSGSYAKTFADARGFATVLRPYGDFNWDGMLTTTDVQLILGFIAGGSATDAQKHYADINKDGELNNHDAVLVYQACSAS